MKPTKKTTKIDFKQLSNLAHLELSATEVAKLEPQLEEIIDYISQLKKIPTKNVQETNQLTGLSNISRPDKTTPSLPQSKALSQAPKVHKGYIKVPGIFNHET